MEEIAEKSRQIYTRLKSLIVEPKSELKFSNEFELLVAVMLSAQCTDKRVNIITESLFKKYKTPADFSALSYEQLAEEIKSCNYYHNKAKNIVNASRMIVDKFGGEIPREHSDLVSLPGVGNKTANVVQAVAFDIPAFAVDTHILRVSNRLGLVSTSNPDKCSEKLMKLFDKKAWGEVHHLILLFGRYYCMARNPKCENCVLCDLCKNALNKGEK